MVLPLICGISFFSHFWAALSLVFLAICCTLNKGVYNVANNRLSAALAAAVLACCCSVGAFAEVASSDCASEPAVSVAASEPAVSSETASSSDLSDTALSADTRYSADEITEILKQHPNAFTTAADPASSSTAEESSSADTSDQQQQSTEPGTIWLKPFVAYTPAEGYLLLLFIMAVSVLTFKLVRFVWL